MRLRELRKKGFEKAKDFAKIIGTDESMVSRFENYRCLPIPEMLDSITATLGCTVPDIYDDDEIYIRKRRTARADKRVGNCYKLTVRLPKRWKEFLSGGALQRCGYADLTDFVMKSLCSLKREDERRKSMKQEVQEVESRV